MVQRNRTQTGILYVILAIIMAVSYEVKADSSNEKGYLGVCIEDLSMEDRDDLNVEHGVLITRVIEESPAEKSGLLEDDIIQYFDGKKVRRSKDLIRYVHGTRPNTEVKIQLVRKDEKKELIVKLGKYRLHKSHAFWNGNDKSVFFSWNNTGYLGVTLQELNRDLAPYFGVDEDSGVLILKVEKDSPAEKADLKSGDILIKVDDKDVADPEEVREILSNFEKGDQIELNVIRKGKQMQFKVILDSRSCCFKIPFEDGHRIDCFKDFRDFRIDLPHIEIDIPEMDIDFKLDKDFEEKLERIENQIHVKTSLLSI
jgi:serine protease Do